MSIKNSPSETRKTVRVGLVLSGFLVAFGFMTMLIPIALYHTAQVAAALRLRSAYSWLALVILVTFGLGFLFLSDALLMGGVLGFLWFPIFVFALYQRKSNAPLIWTAIVFFLPLFFCLAAALLIPVRNHFDIDLMQKLAALQNSIKTDPSFAGLPDAGSMASRLEQSFQQFRLSAEFRFVDTFLKLFPSQRIMWFLFDAQASILFVFGFLINSFASLLFLDHAFEQIEKIQSVAAYVKEHSASFPSEMVKSLDRFPRARRPLTMSIQSHKSLSARSQNGDKWWNIFWRSGHSLYNLELGGYSFSIDVSQSHWWLRGFTLPFWMIAMSSCFLLGLILRVGEPSFIIDWIGAQSVTLATTLVFCSLFSVFCLTLVAIQGLLTLYVRLTTVAMAVFIIILMILVFSVSFNIYLAVGGLAVFGLLDYIYDLRGRLAIRQKTS